ncbi:MULTISPECIES: hypothetical protein [unclassified Rhodococcus (in: high G+C Gram-positive bacteria)]|uniref:hypothetical protein n=1 Tax=unclassified Rhodococcus (in: high G+C Gram-positive bacteria) TaxID=192944 RepID=UPI00163958EE|nr:MULTISPECIES: hypothetical protein [unclassified Rhodococcus (in: high G+C Gram-positive bacteria)]MBC2641539.1 hypothetical protein [Rhodococcus sp. 3A]MBC2893716.1 hypothetical protein [Rhodococcus sp. 4CII]
MNTQVDVARAYLDALLSHDGNAVPIEPRAVRYEVGLKTAFSGNHLRRSLSGGPQYRLIRAIRDCVWSVDGDDVTADYLLDAGLFGRTLVTVRVVETFRIPPDDLRIHRIDARIHLRT